VHNGTTEWERTILLYSLHTSPGEEFVPGALANIAKWMQAYIPSLDAKDVLVIGGDFNANRRDSSELKWYEPLLDLTFKDALDNTTKFKWAGTQNNSHSSPSLLKSVDHAYPSIKPNGYLSTGELLVYERGDWHWIPNPSGKMKAIDGILVAYGDPNGSPPGGVIDRVGGFPKGAEVDMPMSIPDLHASGILLKFRRISDEEIRELLNNKFRKMEYFRHIRRASDHFAVVADV
jgi:hypothetical protein